MKLGTLKTILIVLVVLALIAAGIFFAGRLEQRSEVAPEGAGTAMYSTVRQEEEEAAAGQDPIAGYGEGVDVVTMNGHDYVFNPNLSTLLLIGVDDEEVTRVSGNRNDGLADFLVLAIFDNASKTCKLLQINRNTMAEMRMLGLRGKVIGLTTQQICYAHTYGSGMEDSCEHTVYAVSRLLYNVPIDNYLSLVMGGIDALNDAVGGVTVTIEDDFSGVDDTLVMGKTVTLMGEHAENFVRARMSMTSDPTNEARMRRQRTYINALAEKIKSDYSEDPGFALELYGAIDEYIVTDCAVDALSQYASSLADYTLSEIITPEGTIGHGEYAEFYPDEAALQQLVIDLFYLPYEEEQTQAEEDQPLTAGFGLNAAQ